MGDSNRFHFLAKVHSTAEVESEMGRFRRQILGEIEVSFKALGTGPTSVWLHRIALRSPRTWFKNLPVGQMSASATTAEGEIQRAGERWRLLLHTRHQVFNEVVGVSDLPPKIVNEASGKVFIDFEARPIRRRTQRIKVLDSGLKLFSPTNQASWMRLAVRNTRFPSFVFPSTKTNKLVLPLRRIQFPLPNGGLTGTTWTHLLNQANKVWGKCGIEFKDCGSTECKKNFAYSKEVGKIFRSCFTADEVEIFFIRTEREATTQFGGTAFSKVLLPETASKTHPNRNLLAHELGHVLGGRHPGGGGCDTCSWDGDPKSVLQPHPTCISGKNTAHNCSEARKTLQPMLETLLEEEEEDFYQLNPDP